MTSPELDLEALLRPVELETFFSHHWEQKPLLISRGDPTFYDALLTLADVEAFISRGDVRYPALRLARDGRFYPPEAYTQDFRYGDEVFRGMPDLQKIHTEYSSGATVTLPAWHRAWPPLGRLCARLEEQLDHVINTNVYLTPPRAAGFTPHYDTHEVFVLQIAGSKHWQIHAPPLALPHRSQTFAFASYVAPERAMQEFDLSPGDLAYLPRGYVHTTTTSEQPSLHVTIGVTVYTWVEMLLEWIQSSIEEPAFRHGLPPGFAHRPELRPRLSQRLAELVQQLSRSVHVEAVSERFVKRVLGARQKAPLPFRTDAGSVTAETRLRVVPGVDYSTARDPENLILILEGRRIRLQAAVASTLEAMCRLESFTPSSLPSDLSLQARLSLVRYLCGLQFLETM